MELVSSERLFLLSNQAFLSNETTSDEKKNLSEFSDIYFIALHCVLFGGGGIILNLQGNLQSATKHGSPANFILYKSVSDPKQLQSQFELAIQESLA